MRRRSKRSATRSTFETFHREYGVRLWQMHAAGERLLTSLVIGFFFGTKQAHSNKGVNKSAPPCFTQETSEFHGYCIM